MTVLIAEDDPISRHILEATLESWGYQVRPCAGGSRRRSPSWTADQLP